MEINTRHRRIVCLVDLASIDAGFLTCSVKAVTDVDPAFFGADPEGTGLVVREVEASYGDFAGSTVVALVRELERFLQRGPRLACTRRRSRGTYLRNREHIAHPGTYCSVRTGSDQVVCVVRTHELHRIDRIGMAAGG